MKRETKELVNAEFKDMFQFFQDCLNDVSTINQGWKNLEASLERDVSATWKLLQRGGATKGAIGGRVTAVALTQVIWTNPTVTGALDGAPLVVVWTNHVTIMT